MSYDMPKSFVVTEERVYITNVSVFTLKRRAAPAAPAAPEAILPLNK